MAVALVWACGADRPAPADEQPPGFWFEGGRQAGPAGLSAIGYAPGYEADAGGWTGLRVAPSGSGHDPAPGLPALFASGHEPAAFVLHGDGRVERRWFLGPGADRLPPYEHPSQRSWRALLPLEDGGLVAVHEGLCLVRVGADSSVRWVGAPRAHHDVLRLGPDRVAVLDRERRPRIDAGACPHPAPFLSDDGIRVLSLTTGETLRRFSLVDALRASRWRSLLEEAWPACQALELGDGTGALALGLDPLHANGIELAHASGASGASGGSGDDEVMVFLRDLGAIARVDLGDGSLLRLDVGPWRGAHDPVRVPGRPGWYALFDNHGARGAEPPRSRAVLTDGLRTEPIVTGPGVPPVHSPVCGAVAPLEGGGWLLTSTTEGRAVAVDGSGALLWEFRTPFRVREDGLVAALLDMRPLGAPPFTQPR